VIDVWEVALWLVILWLGGLLFQIADLGTAWLDLRTARTSTGQLARRRAHELFWVAPLAALLALGFAFGVDLAVRMVLERGILPVIGVLLVLAVLVLVVAGAMVATIALLTRDVQSYALLRFAISDAQTRKLTKADVAEWRAELQAIDEREAVRHERIARILRLIPIGLSLAAFVALWVAVIVDLQNVAPGEPWGPVALGVAAVLIPATSVVMAIRSARVSLRARASWSLVNGKQREALVRSLDELERRTSRGVAGLSDRVNRALQILREQQL
jgi:hypothetical protein